MSKIKNFLIASLLVFSAPMLALAQVSFSGSATTCSGVGIGSILCQIGSLLNSVIPVLIALGVVYFIWGVIQFVVAGGEEAKTKGRDTIIYGVIGLACIIGLWGLVAIVVNTFDLGVAAPTLTPLAGADSGSACGIGNRPVLQNLLEYATCLLNNSVIPLIFAIAVVMFVWGVVQFVILGASEEAKTKGKNMMIWGIIALTVMLSVWGLVKIAASTFGVNTSVLPQVKP